MFPRVRKAIYCLARGTCRRGAIFATFSFHAGSHILAAVARMAPSAPANPLAERLRVNPLGLGPQGKGGDGHEPSRPEIHFQSHPDLRSVSLLRRVCSCSFRPAGRFAWRRFTRQRWVARWKLAWRRRISRRQRSQGRSLRRIRRFDAFRRRKQRFFDGKFFEQRSQLGNCRPCAGYEFHG